MGAREFHLAAVLRARLLRDRDDELRGGAVRPFPLRLRGVPSVPASGRSFDRGGDADLEEYFVVTACKIDEQWIEFTLGNGYSAKTRRPLER